MTERHASYNLELEELLKPMTRKQSLFCREYWIDLNATQAAIRAGYSENSAQQIASENLCKPVIIAAMDCFFEARHEQIDINAELIEREYWKLYRISADKDTPADRSVARQCLKDLGEYHAMFIKQVAFLDGGALEDRLSKGRARLNEGHALNPSPAGPADPVQ